tara:strand:+ start:153 stop:647 length:495 start_codon:yes stop_codon:yes gene_type:complete
MSQHFNIRRTKMNLQNKLREANLSDDEAVVLTYSAGGDIIHARDGYVEDVLDNTGFAETVSEVITTTGFNNGAIDDLRGQDLLEGYERDGSGFESFVAEVLSENVYEVNFIDQTIEQYDYKRGFLTLAANVRTTVKDVLAAPENLFVGWSTNVETDIGTLRIDG